MTKEEVKKLNHGLYKVYWKSGGSSLAAVGSLHDGGRWLAPCNWSSADKMTFDSSYWKIVKSVTLITDKV